MQYSLQILPPCCLHLPGEMCLWAKAPGRTSPRCLGNRTLKLLSPAHSGRQIMALRLRKACLKSPSVCWPLPVTEAYRNFQQNIKFLTTESRIRFRNKKIGQQAWFPDFLTFQIKRFSELPSTSQILRAHLGSTRASAISIVPSHMLSEINNKVLSSIPPCIFPQKQEKAIQNMNSQDFHLFLYSMWVTCHLFHLFGLLFKWNIVRLWPPRLGAAHWIWQSYFAHWGTSQDVTTFSASDTSNKFLPAPPKDCARQI